MNKFKFMELCDFSQGDFAIKNGNLYYKGKLIATKNDVVLVSSEEAFFLFELQRPNDINEFSFVLFLNSRWPKFFKGASDLFCSTKFLQFIDARGQQHAFRVISHENSSVTKIICANFEQR